MPITFGQYQELQKLESTFNQLEILAERLHLDLDDLSCWSEFPNLHDAQQRELQHKSIERGAVFSSTQRAVERKK